MGVNNKAAWLTKAQAELEVKEGPEPKLEKDDVLIENKAVAINPVDWKMQSAEVTGKVPTILGHDVAGKVVDIGSSVTKVKKGDHVLGHCLTIGTGKLSQAGFQTYTTLPEMTVCPFPQSMSFEAAAVIPLGLSTAMTALYMKDYLALPYPKPGAPQPSGRSILIWGGSSSVGANAVQLAAASGLQVAVTCSKRNHDMVKGLGATRVFDHSEASVVEKIVEFLSGSNYAGAFDTIGEPETLKLCGAVTEKLRGSLVVGTQPVPEGLSVGKGVAAVSFFALEPVLKEPAVADAIYRDFLPEAIRKGQYVAKPDPMVTGHGLESLQNAVNTLKRGVSGAKVVVTL